MRTFVSAILAALLISCAGTPFDWDDTAKIRNGMTEAEVIAILGPPYSRSQSGGAAILTWSYKGIGSPARAVAYRFHDGRVTGITTIGK